MQDVTQLIDQQVSKADLVIRWRAFSDYCGSEPGIGLNRRRFCKDPAIALVPWSAGVDFAMLTRSGRVIEELVDQSGSRCNAADTKGWLAHALKRQRKRFHVGNFSCHQKLKRVLCAGIV